MFHLSVNEARRVAVAGAMLCSPKPKTVLQVVEHLGRLQIDPTKVVARTEHLVLFSRLGRYDIKALDEELWSKKTLFEYWAHIMPVGDFAIHRASMRRRFSGKSSRHKYVTQWLRDNAAFRRYVLARLRKTGPLRTSDFEDRATVPWATGGWNDGRSVSPMLEILQGNGEIAIAGRDGQHRLWDLAARCFPVEQPELSDAEIARKILDRQLRVKGIARPKTFGWSFDGRPPGWQAAMNDLVGDGTAVPVRVVGLKPGTWYAHRDALAAKFKPRTTVLSPFDPLIYDRNRTHELWDFFYRLEIYVPKAKRQYGYFVLPILHGEKLIGRIDPAFDPKTKHLKINAVRAETARDETQGLAVARSIKDLAVWLGARSVEFAGAFPTAWRDPLVRLTF